MVRAGGRLWTEVSRYLDEALELEPARREAWLCALIVSQPQLASELRELLALDAANRASRFMERSLLITDETLVGQRIGPYTIERLLGRGGMGSVWLARRSDGKFEGQVAIKLLDRRGLGRDAAYQIRHEASLLARLSHPHIARLFDAGVHDNGQPYLVLEYVEGDPIDRYCATRDLPLDARLRLFASVLDAVAHAHAQLVVHRDLKPSNVLVTHEGIVKLLDFGVAALQTQATQPAFSDTGPQPLTPGYAAPEQLRGEPVSTAADVYALGVLLYVLVTGEHPCGTRHSTRTQLVRSTLTDEPGPASERLASAAERRRVRGDLDAVVARALSRDPAARYTTAAQFASDIRAYLGNFPVHARAPTRAYAARKFAQRHRGAVVSALLTLLILTGATVVTTLQTLEARRQRDFARAALARAQAINELNRYVLFDAAPGETFTTTDLLGRALHVLERQQTADPNRVALLTSVGFGYEMQSDHAEGKRILTQAYDLSRATSDATARASAACALADSLSNEHNTRRSEALINDGLRELPRAPEFALDRYFCLLRGQQVAKVSGDTQLAIRRGEAALAALKDVPFAHDLEDVEAYESLASALREAGRMHEAQAAYAAAWPRLVALGRDDTFDAATLLGNWAQVLLQMGRPLEAQQYKQRELEIKLAVPDSSAASMSLTNYAQLLFELARLDEAADYAERAYREAVKADNQLVLNQTRLRLARIYREQHDSTRATRMLDEAEVPMRQLLPPGHFAFASLTTERALVACEQENFPRALQLINEALEITEEADRHGKAGAQFLPILLTHRAEIELAAAQLAPAGTDARQALALLATTAQPGDYSVYAGRAELTLARVLAAGGESSEARSAANRAVQQLTKAEGADHPETLAALRLSGGPSLDERIE